MIEAKNVIKKYGQVTALDDFTVDIPKGKIGTKFKVHLPEKYSNTPGTPVDAVVVDIPFKESFNANTREVVKG